MQGEINRRELLAAASRMTCIFGTVSALPFVFSGCSAPDDAATNERLRAALQTWIGDDSGAARIRRASGTTSAAALRTLCAGVSNRCLVVVSANEFLLRRFLDHRRSDDLRAGRTRPIRGWWLSETEVAVAVLAGP
jgi:hypothetical protein